MKDADKAALVSLTCAIIATRKPEQQVSECVDLAFQALETIHERIEIQSREREGWRVR